MWSRIRTKVSAQRLPRHARRVRASDDGLDAPDDLHAGYSGVPSAYTARARTRRDSSVPRPRGSRLRHPDRQAGAPDRTAAGEKASRDLPRGDQGPRSQGADERTAEWSGLGWYLLTGVSKRLKFMSPFIAVGIVVNPSTYVADEGLPFIYGVDIAEGRIDAFGARRLSVSGSRRN